MRFMSTDLLRNNRAAITILLIVSLFALVAACGGDAEEPASGDTPTIDKAEIPTAAPAAEPTEPVLINTPVPVANLAPDFTLPSIQGPEYTLSSFKGDKPVLVVFYRAYW